jgi:prepilin peptidase CpaA
MFAFLMAATLITAIAAFTDYRSGHIPNWVTLPALCAGVVGHLGYGWYRFGFTEGVIEGGTAIAGAALCSLAPGLMYWKGGMGGGDLKLFAALGALCQPMIGIEAETYAFVVAALVAPARLAYQGRLFAVLKNTFALLMNPLRSAKAKREVPPEMMTWFRLGPSIFIGMVAALVAHSYEL